MTKACTTCGVEKELGDYHKRGDSDKIRSSCKMCINKSNLGRYHTSPTTKEAHRMASRRHSLKKYGLTEEQYIQMYEAQKGLCKICNTPIATIHENRHESSCVDHCHTTGRVRALLCWHCNIGLGKFFDNPAILLKAADYLQSTR